MWRCGSLHRLSRNTRLLLFSFCTRCWRQDRLCTVRKEMITTRAKVNRHTEEQRQREISNVVDEKSKTIIKKRTVVQQGMNMSRQPTLPHSRIKFHCVLNSCFTVISDHFSYHLDRKLRLPEHYFSSEQKTSRG